MHPAQVKMLWDELLPDGITTLPADLARLDAVLADPALLATFRARFAAEAAALRNDPLHRGRPTIAMTTYLRLRVVKAAHGVRLR